MSRIESSKINIGESYIIEIPDDSEIFKNITNNDLTPQEQTEVEEKAHQIIIAAEAKANAIADKAEKNLEAAKQEAENMKKDAYDEAYKKGYDDGHEKGYNDGYQEATSIVKDETSEKIQALNKFISASLDAKKHAIKSLNKELADIICNFVETICYKIKNIDAKIVSKVLEAAVLRLTTKEEITIYINPAMFAKINEAIELIKEDNLQIKNINLVEDINLEEDGIMVETPDTRINAAFSSYLKEVLNKILEKSYSFSDEELEENYGKFFESVGIPDLAVMNEEPIPETFEEKDIREDENI